MASPSRASGSLVLKTRSRARGSSSRLTPVQLTKIAREECEKLMGEVSSIYSTDELAELQQKELREFEPDRLPADDPQRPTWPEATAPIQDFNRLRLLDGLEGVLHRRGKIDDWLDQLQTKERQEQLAELDDWFEEFKHQGIDFDQFFRRCESEVEQGRILCQRSKHLVSKLAKDTTQTRHEVKDFVDQKLKPMAGSEGGMKAIEKRLWLMKMRHSEAEVVKEATAERLQEKEQALVQARKNFYDERLSRMKMEQAEQDELVNLQQEIEKRQEELEKLNREVATQAKAARDVEGFVKFGRKCLTDGRPIESKDPDFDALLVKYRDHALNRKRHIRTVVCRRIDELEKQAEENRAASGILRDWTREANAEATNKENVMEMVSARRPSIAKDAKAAEPHQTALSRVKNDLLRTMQEIRSERGRIDKAVKRKKVIAEAISHCEGACTDVRKHLWRAMPKILLSLEEEKRAGQRTSQLPSKWRDQLEEEWSAVEKFTELYGSVLFGVSLEPKRMTVAEASDVVADAEAIGQQLQELELMLSCSEADPSGWEAIDPWLAKEYASASRLKDLRGLQQEMFEQARKVAADLPPDAYILEGVNLTEILQKDVVKSPKRFVRKGTTKRL